MQQDQFGEKSNLKEAFKEGINSTKDKILNIAKKPSDEGTFTAGVENVTSKAPSIFWLSCAAGSMVISAALLMTKRKELANFVGLWAPSFMLIGVYNKLVKLEGNDAHHKAGVELSQPPLH